MNNSLRKLISPDSEKQAKNIQKALENGNSTMYYSAFCTEAAAGNVTDFPTNKAAVSGSFFCDYGNFAKIGLKLVRIIPLAAIVNVYRSNMVNSEYDYETFRLAIELNNGATVYCCPYVRNAKNSMTIYEDLIKSITDHKNKQLYGMGG